MVFGEVTAEFALGQHPIVELELRCLKRARSRRSAMTVFLETSLINERHKWAAFATLSGYSVKPYHSRMLHSARPNPLVQTQKMAPRAPQKPLGGREYRPKSNKPMLNTSGDVMPVRAVKKHKHYPQPVNPHKPS